MKLTAIILLACSLHVAATTNSQTISFSGKAVPLHKAFDAIEKQTGFYVFSKKELLQRALPVTVDVRNMAVSDFLSLILKDQAIDFIIKDKNILISPKATPAITDGPPTPFNLSPPITVRGRIVNEKGEPVVASIVVKGSNKGATTDADGNFELTNVDDQAQLIVSGINIETQTISINRRNSLTIKATTKIAAEDEVIINGGYYKVEERKRTGNISRVTSKDIEKQPVTSPLMALQGRMAGVDITPVTGVPGTATKIQIRGVNSLRADGNYPLYVIDGVPVDSRPLQPTSYSTTMVGLGFDPLSTINPSNIASIDVLKDADATAIYGSRGANGVVLITTKQGNKTGKTGIDLNIYQGAGTTAGRAKLLNTKQYLEVRREGFANDNKVPEWYDFDLFYKDSTRDVDWQKELIGGTSEVTDAQLALTGGNGNTNFRLGIGYHRESMVFPGDFYYSKINGSFSLNHQSTNERFKTNLQISYGADRNKLFDDGGALVNAAFTLSPNSPALYDSLGNLNWENSTWTNPLGATKNSHLAITGNLVVNSMTSYQLFKPLTIKLSAGYTDLNSVENTRQPLVSYDPMYAQYYQAGGGEGNNNRKSWIVEPQINYTTGIGEGIFNILAGASLQQSSNLSRVSAWGGIPSDLLIDNPNAGTVFFQLRNENTQYKYAAVFARAGYEFKNKYLLNLTGRRDGSSRFGPGRQYANFGSIGAAWIFSNENFFLKKMRFINFGKLRMSYGSTGNDGIGESAFLDVYLLRPNRYGSTPAVYPLALFNSDYRWEQTTKFETALEFSLLDNRVGGQLAWYRNRSTGQLIENELPYSTGFPSVMSNFPATVQNGGIEIELRADIIRSKTFNWNINVNYSRPRNKLVKFPGLETSPYASRYIIGESISIDRLYNYKGVNPATGFYEMVDVNGDGKIIFDNDATYIYNKDRLYFGGINNIIQYKNIEFNFLLQYTNQNGRLSMVYPPGTYGNQLADVLGRWQKPGDIAAVQKFTSDTYGSGYASFSQYTASTGSVNRTSFIRLKTATLSYKIPGRLFNTLNNHSASVFVQGQNLFLISKFKGPDPETGFSIPQMRFITVGFQVKL